MKKYIALGVFLGAPFIVAFLGSSVTTPSINSWYTLLNKPSFSPPNWVFAPVWTILFLLMGIASYLVWKRQKRIRTPLKFYGVQLILNFLWSYLFFGLHRPDLALLGILSLWVFIFLTTKSFYKVDRLAGLLFFPYLLWVSFAVFLNYSILTLN